MNVFEEKIKGVPQFVSYFGPILDILRDLGGQAKPAQVYDELVSRYEMPESLQNQVNKNGNPTYKNRVNWARFYLVKAGLIYSPKYGTWGLTDAGQAIEISDERAAEIFQEARATFKVDEDEDKPPEGEDSSDGVSYWFVGALWGDDDQTERFLRDGIWQNGYQDKFSDVVKQMKQGDKIAIKATFTRKNDVPLENRGRTVSVMKVKARGTITKNQGDGRTVQ